MEDLPMSVEETDHFKAVCAAYFNYQVNSLFDVGRMKRDLAALPESHKKMLLYPYEERISRIQHCIV